MRTNISLEEAQELLLGMVSPGGETTVSLRDALGRVISREIKAPCNMPPFDRSPYDGYALRAVDTELASPERPVFLRVIEEVVAGSWPARSVAPGCAIRLMTGSPIPEGADVVVPFEEVEETPDGISIKRPLAAGSNIIPAGSEVVEGEIIAQSGKRANAYLIGMLASFGISRVPVYEKAKAAVIATGSELLEITEKLLPGKIYCSNLYLLEARCRELGAEPIFVECVPDDEKAIASSLVRALEVAELVLVTGGTSLGSCDFVKGVLEAIGAQCLFSRIALRPGAPTSAAFRNGKVILSLAGNPGAAMVVFELLAVPILKKLAGERETLLPKITGVLVNDFPKQSPCRRILKANWKRQDGVDLIELIGGENRGSWKLPPGCALLVDVPPGSPPLAAGQRVSAFVVSGRNSSFLVEN